MANREIYTVLGRPVTKEQYEEAGKKMKDMEKDLPEGLLEFGKAARERAAQRKMAEEKEPVKKAKGGMVSSASKRADGIAIKGKTKGRFV